MKKLTMFAAVLAALALVFGFTFADAGRDIIISPDEGNYNPLSKSLMKQTFVPDEILVKFDAKMGKQKIKKILAYFQMKNKNSWKKGTFNVLKLKNRSRTLDKVIEKLNRIPGVVYAEKNYIAHKTMTPNDPYYSPYQWHMTRIGMEDAWDLNTGSGATVAIIDTGVKQSLEDLANTNFVAGYDFVNNDNDPTDDEGHGSHVCGTVAQSTNNSIGVTGVAFNCSIMPIKVLNSQGSGTYADIADGIIWATDHGAGVINLSLGGSSGNSTLQNAVNYAWNNGVVVVCAAGNSSTSAPFYPAAYTNSISVSAVNYLDQLADYSNYGSTIDICAPGGDSDDNNGDGYMDGVLQNTFGTSGDGYYFYTGTSMASPHVAGVAALVKSANSSLTNAEIRNILETTAEDLGASGWDQYFGQGIVDALAAVQAAGGGGNQYPVADFTYSTNLLTVTFTDQSYDPDGTIVSWDWNFGDSNTSTAQNPVHTYAASGTYSVTLTVTDDEGATDDIAKDVTVSDGSEPEIYVFDIAMQKFSWWIIYRAEATITIKDTDGSVVPNATVYIQWSGKASGTDSGTTNSSGQVTFDSGWYWGNGTFTVTVTDVTHATLNYNSSLNNETSDSI